MVQRRGSCVGVARELVRPAFASLSDVVGVFAGAVGLCGCLAGVIGGWLGGIGGIGAVLGWLEVSFERGLDGLVCLVVISVSIAVLCLLDVGVSMWSVIYRPVAVSSSSYLLPVFIWPVLLLPGRCWWWRGWYVRVVSSGYVAVDVSLLLLS